MSEWWAIHGDDIRHALQRVADGDNPDIVYAELYANAEHEQVSDEQDQ